MKPLAISWGDPAGVGPEVVLKALAKAPAELGPALVVGDAARLAEAAERLGLPLPAEIVEAPGVACGSEVLFAGAPSAASGTSGAAAVRGAIQLVQSGRAAAIVTAPLNKEALGLAGEPYPGHTELLATELEAPQTRMMLQGGGLRVILVTTHIALRDVPGALTKEGILETARTADQGLRELGIAQPRLALAALNPHASDGGRFGDEEALLLEPAVAALQAEGVAIEGPLPADTLFAQAVRPERGIDAVIALYHDQGLIPVKLAAFGGATNVTLGLPIVRTSPDHGTAYDIAGQGQAEAESFLEAMRVARQLVAARGG